MLFSPMSFFSRIALLKNVFFVCVCVCVCVCVRACGVRACVCEIVAPGHVLDMETGTRTSLYKSKNTIKITDINLL